VDPYRGELVGVEPRTLVAEPERPPRGVRVRAWSDGTTELRLSSPRPLVDAALAVAAMTLGAPRAARRIVRAQRVEVTPAAVFVRRRGGDAVLPRADALRVEVATTRVVIVGRDSQLVVADRLGYGEETLRWIALRLRRALEAAR
jgi:hypothetical protein